MIIFNKTTEEWKTILLNNSDYLLCFVIGLILGLLI